MHDMTKFYLLTIKALLLLSLTGCGLLLFSVPTVWKADIPNYSLGPVSSDEFPVLLQDAIPAGEGEVHVFGRVELFGLKNNSGYFNTSRYFYFRAVAAITNTDILLLKWHEPEERYKIVGRLPYSETLSVSISGGSADGTIHLYFKDKELSLGDQNFEIDQKADLTFIKPSGIFIDREKNEAAFGLLREKISIHFTPEQTFDDDY